MSEISKSIADGQATVAHTRKTIKILSLGLVSLALSLLTWWVIHAALYGQKPLLFWGWAAGAMVLWTSVICLFVLVNPYRWAFTIINVWSLVVYLAIMPRNIYVAAGGVGFFLLSMLYERWIRSEEKNQINFSVRRTIGSSVVIANYAFLLLVGLNIYYNTDQDFKNNPDKFYNRLGETAASSIPFVSKNLTPGADLNKSLDQYLTEEAQDNPEYQNLNENSQDQFLATYREQFLKQFGIDAAGNEQLATVLSRIINEKAKEVLGRFERFFPLIFTLIIIALLRTFSFVFNWVVIIATWLIYKILLGLKFFRIVKATVEVDKLDI
jgi:hypothetical protein